MKLISARMYAYFLLAAATLALPPLALLTIPAIIAIAVVGHRQRNRHRTARAIVADEQYRRAVIAATKSL